ncbi:uncharacterized protein LOC132748460 [Ruditapes philippinarum]|uniref:uncharacterized protein LOC132748460 n=1 Tax=Ruditapes philippinarum TaxID=129788 RepID=UPI00295C1107|nr:uncharacterized protein LOC132748460 [Ruditapes philippinarum]
MMGSINIFSLLFILKLLQTDASINIYQSGVQAGSGHFECGEEFVLTCQIDSYSVSMALQNDSSNVPLAECFLNTCTLNPDVANRYTLSTNTATGTFNLTFNVSNYHNGTTFMCDDASNSKSSLFLMNDYEPNIIETNQTQLEVMSGCINSGVTVTFLWKKVEAKTMTESEYKFDFSNKHEYSNATICELDEECGGQGLIKRIISIDVEEEGTDEYYLKAILSYPGVKKEILTSKTYKIKQGKNMS